MVEEFILLIQVMLLIVIFMIIKLLMLKEAFGGGIYFDSGSGSLDNCTFANNLASQSWCDYCI